MRSMSSLRIPPCPAFMTSFGSMSPGCPGFSEQLLLPLEEIDPDIKHVFSEYLPTLEDKYCYVRNKIYALPFSPSSQLLFYRKDLFENIAVKRIYQEKYRQELTVPRTFREYNQIAAFFTEGTGFDSNVRYGTHLTPWEHRRRSNGIFSPVSSAIRTISMTRANESSCRMRLGRKPWRNWWKRRNTHLERLQSGGPIPQRILQMETSP